MDFLYILLIELIGLTLVALAVTMAGKKFLRLNEVPSGIPIDSLLPKLARRAIGWLYLPVFLIILLWFLPVPGLIIQGFHAVLSFLGEKGILWPVLLLTVLLCILFWQITVKEKIKAVSKKVVSFLEERWLKEEPSNFFSFNEEPSNYFPFT
ncbi:MAG: hypothetical protein HGB11_11895, partial [Chlorobiales bacterium]|nr:hypothetical protein [Chlorobiales bacterium]